MLIDWTYAHIVSGMDSEQRAEFDDALDSVRHAEERARQDRQERLALIKTMELNSSAG